MKTRIVLLLLVVIGSSVTRSSAQDFTLTTSATNIVSSKASIDRPGIAGNPLAIIVATPIGDTAKNNPHAIGAWYYKDRWNIFNTDHAVMPVNARYKIEYFPTPDANHFLYIVTASNLGDDGSYLDNPALNGNPNAVFKILQNYVPDNRAGYSLNPNEAKAMYNSASGKWYIANVNGKFLLPNTAYSVVIYPDEAKPAAMPPTAQPVPTPSREPVVPSAAVPVPTRSREPIAPTTTTSNPVITQASCTKEMAYQTVGKWGKQKTDDLAMADRSFPKEQYKAALAKAQKAIELFKQAIPEFKGIEASAKRGIRGDSYPSGGPLPFYVDVGHGGFICVGNDTYKVEMRGKIILFGGYNYTTVQFNSLRDVLDTVIENGGFSTIDGDEIFEYKKELGEFKGFTMIEPLVRDEDHHEAIIITSGNLPYKAVTREQFLRARIKNDQSKSSLFADEIAALNSALSNMSAAERQTPAIVRDVSATPGRVNLFATEAEGGRHLVTVDKSYFNPNLPRDAIQLITVHWNWNDDAIPKIDAVRQFKQNFDFQALKQMLGK